MGSEALREYRKWYAKLLRFYPKSHRERFGEAMEQTFNDLCRARVRSKKSLLGFALGTFFETGAAITKENAIMLMKSFINRGSTIFLRAVIILIAIAALAVCVFPLPRGVAYEAAKGPDTAWQIYVFLVGAYIQAALFFFALYQAFKLLSHIDGNKAFSELSVRALRRVKHSALTIGLVMVAGLVWLRVLSAGTGEDSAGPTMLGLIGTLASSVVAAVAGILQTQVRQVINIKKEGPL